MQTSLNSSATACGTQRFNPPKKLNLTTMFHCLYALAAKLSIHPLPPNTDHLRLHNGIMIRSHFFFSSLPCFQSFLILALQRAHTFVDITSPYYVVVILRIVFFSSFMKLEL